MDTYDFLSDDDALARLAARLTPPRINGPDGTAAESGTLAGYDRPALHRMADAIQGRPARRILVFTADRGIAAAALMSALSGGPELLLPDSLTCRSFRRLLEEESFEGVIGREGEFPADILRPSASSGSGSSASSGSEQSRSLSLPKGTWLQLFSPENMNPTDPNPSVGAGPCACPRPISNACAPSPPDRVIVRFFTGGSTGRPRQWPKTLRNVLGEAGFQAAFHGIGPADRILATVPLFHIYGFLFSVALPLISGAGVSPETPVFPREIRDRLADQSATVLVSVPPHYRAVGVGEPLSGLPLRMALSSAGRLEPEDEAAFFRISGVPVTEIFGSTETGGIAWRRRSGGVPDLRPFPVVEWKTDPDERLRVNSPFLAPDAPRDPEGFFRTGDRIRPLENGGIALLGRADGIVKVGGERVDLEEIRKAVLSLDGVKDAHALALPDRGGRENRVGVLIATGSAGKDSPDWTAAKIKSALSEKLPAAALPKLIRICETLPLTPSGKTDRQAVESLFSASGS